MSCSSNIVPSVVFCTTLKSNGKSSGNLWVYQRQKELNNSLPVISLILVSQKLFERKLVALFLLDNSSKGFDANHWWEIYLVAFLTRSVLAACFVALLCITSTWPFDMIANEYRKIFTITKNSCVKYENSTKR